MFKLKFNYKILYIYIYIYIVWLLKRKRFLSKKVKRGKIKKTMKSSRKRKYFRKTKRTMKRSRKRKYFRKKFNHRTKRKRIKIMKGGDQTQRPAFPFNRLTDILGFNSNGSLHSENSDLFGWSCRLNGEDVSLKYNPKTILKMKTLKELSREIFLPLFKEFK